LLHPHSFDVLVPTNPGCWNAGCYADVVVVDDDDVDVVLLPARRAA